MPYIPEYSAKPRERSFYTFSPWFGLIANAVLLVFALQYLFYPSGQVFTQSTGFITAACISAICGLTGIALVVIDVIHRKFLPVCLGLFLTLTPLPLYLTAFELIAWAKGFRFV